VTRSPCRSCAFASRRATRMSVRYPASAYGGEATAQTNGAYRAAKRGEGLVRLAGLAHHHDVELADLGRI
jgi:hypothetical protein